MGESVKNYFRADKLEANEVISLNSTTTTSLSIVTAITTSKTTEFDFNVQTLYFTQGVISDLGAESTSTVTTSTN
jgi:hypothetical protein